MRGVAIMTGGIVLAIAVGALALRWAKDDLDRAAEADRVAAPAEKPPGDGAGASAGNDEDRIVDTREERAPSRVIGGDTIAAPSFDAASLERLPPRPPLSGSADSGSQGDEGYRLLFRPLVVNAVELRAQNYRIRLAGIEPVSPAAICPTLDGTGVSCSRLAMTALRMWIRGRAIECEVPASPPLGQIATRCRLAGTDLAGWLVRNGWALAAGAGTYGALEAAARADGRGVHRQTR